MKDLRCAMNNCAFNKSFCCRARKIRVTEGADCGTYDPKTAKKNDSNVMFEAGMEGFSQRLKQPDVLCDAASCLFNRAEICRANGISVIGEKKEPVCASYIEK